MEGQFRFFSLNKPEDWSGGVHDNLDVTADGLRIKQTEKYHIRRIVRFGELEGIGEIHDLAIGGQGKLYMLDEHANLWMYDDRNRYHEALFRGGHGLFGAYALLAADGDVLFVADPTGERALSAFSVSNGQMLWSLADWNDQPLYPLSITVDSGQFLYVLHPLDVAAGPDGHAEIPEAGRFGVLKLTLSGEVVAVMEHDKFVLKRTTPLKRLRRSFYSATSRSGEVSIFDSIANVLYTFAPDGEMVSRIFLPPFQFAGLTIDSKNNVYIGDSRSIAEEGEDDRFILNFGATGELIAKVSGFRGKTDKLALDRDDRMYVFDGEQQALTTLELQRRTMEGASNGRLEAVYLSGTFDTAVQQTEWHKLELFADIPDEAQVLISYFASDRLEHVVGDRIVRLDEYVADPDISMHEKQQGLLPLWTKTVVNPKDALFFGAKGRYLWLKIAWIGSEQNTPLIHKLRVHYPRMSYLSYLPALYQEEETSRRFLERYLSLFAAFFNDLDDRIEHIARYFDSDLASGPFLKWLGSWLGIEVDDNWNETQLRRLVQQAPELYRLRGTRQGISKIIEIYTGEKPYIIEHFQLKKMRDIAGLRELAAHLYADNPYCFTVLIKPEYVESEKERTMIQAILDGQKPAYTEARLVPLQPWMYMDMHSYIGVNTYLSEPSLMALNPMLTMPNDTLIVDFDLDNRIDIHSRLEIDSEME